MEHAIARSHQRSTIHEGAILGAAMATGIWLWLATIDVIAGTPFRTLSLLGNAIVVTLVHYALNILYGVVLVGAVRGARRAPSLIIAVIFGLIMMEIALAMMTVLLGQLGLGNLAWLRIFGGSIVGLSIAMAALSRRYPLAARLREAEEES